MERDNVFPFPDLLEEVHPNCWDEDDEDIEEIDDDGFDSEENYEIAKAA